MPITISGDSPNFTNATLTTPTLTSPTLTNATLTNPTSTGAVFSSMASSVITSGTAATASGASVDFTSIPSWVKRITVIISGVSTNGTGNLQIQIGDSGGFETTGYLGAVTSGTVTENFTSGYLIDTADTDLSSSIRHGVFTLVNLSGNTWVINGSCGLSNTTFVMTLSGSKALSDTLTQVRITTVSSEDNFDAGSINILYE